MRDRILAIVQKEVIQALRTRMTQITLVILTLIFVFLPLGQGYLMGENGPLKDLTNRPVDANTLRLVGQMYPQLKNLSPSATVQALLLGALQPLFLIAPLTLPMIIAVYSIIGEKQTRSLEALLATPVETGELLAGKCLAAAIPGILSAWISYALFAVLAVLVFPREVYQVIVLRPEWLLALLLFTPAGAFLGVILGLIVSSRASDPQAAQQVAGVVVIPVVALLLGQIAGIVQLSVLLVILGSLILLAVDAGLLFAAVKLFQRETILTRWK